MKPTERPGPQMTLGNMRKPGVSMSCASTEKTVEFTQAEVIDRAAWKGGRAV